MKILFLKPLPLTRSNGGDICNIERLKKFKEWNIDISIHLLLPKTWELATKDLLSELRLSIEAKQHFIEGLDPENLETFPLYEKLISEIISAENPTLIMSHYTDFLTTAPALKLDASKVWVDMSDNEFPRLEKLQEFPLLHKYYSQIKTALVASSFMEREVKKSFPKIETKYLPNILDISLNESATIDPQYWLFVNPVEVKGLSFVLELARELPEESFVFVGNWNNDAPENLPKNIRFVPQQKNLNEVFSKAKGLLFPSIWEEAFGRIPLEAMACGVPVISSNRGALPVTVGSGGTVLPLEKSVWISAMRQLTQNISTQRVSGFKRFNEYQKEVTAAYEGLRQSLMIK